MGKKRHQSRSGHRQRDGSPSTTRQERREDDCKRLYETIGPVVRRARREKKLTQSDVAERIGLTSEFYARIERGHCLPSIQSLARLVAVLTVEADVLLGFKSADQTVHSPDISWGEGSIDRPEIRRMRRILRKARPQTLRVVKSMLDAIDRFDQ